MDFCFQTCQGRGTNYSLNPLRTEGVFIHDTWQFVGPPNKVLQKYFFLSFYNIELYLAESIKKSKRK